MYHYYHVRPPNCCGHVNVYFIAYLKGLARHGKRVLRLTLLTNDEHVTLKIIHFTLISIVFNQNTFELIGYQTQRREIREYNPQTTV